MTTSTHEALDAQNAHDAHDHDPHAADAADAADALGPIDVFAWGAGALGIALGLVVAACFVLATATISR